MDPGINRFSIGALFAAPFVKGDRVDVGRTFALLAERSHPIRALLARGAQPRGKYARWSQALSTRAAPGCRSLPPRSCPPLDPANGYAVVG